MAGDDRETVMPVLRTVLAERADRPTTDFRRNAWLAFQAALDRHLTRRVTAQRPMQLQR